MGGSTPPIAPPPMVGGEQITNGGSRYGSDFGEISKLPPMVGGSMGGSNGSEREGVGGEHFP